MSEIRIEPKHLGDRLVAEGERILEAQKQACVDAAIHLVAYLREQTDEQGITDLGVYKNSHKFARTEDGAVTYNDAPHSGIVEEGARPHYVSREGVEALKRWCVRKLGLSEKEADSAAWAIANKIAAVGTTGRFLYRDSQGVAREYYDQELARILRDGRPA